MPFTPTPIFSVSISLYQDILAELDEEVASQKQLLSYAAMTASQERAQRINARRLEIFKLLPAEDRRLILAREEKERAMDVFGLTNGERAACAPSCQTVGE